MAERETDTAICPTCGEGPFKTRQGMKAHHKQVHGESLAGVPVECANCGEQTRVSRSSKENSKRNFCDRWCNGEWLSEHNTGEDHWQYKERVDLECEICGEAYEVVPSREDISRTCSRKCLDKLRSKVHSGRDHYNWKGGHVRYGAGWHERKREMVRERDNRECQHCGLSEERHIEIYGRKHNIHHIVPAREFDDPEKRNAMENLVTLCQNKCHNKWEAMAPLKPDTE